jgi:hypothetical protein
METHFRKKTMVYLNAYGFPFQGYGFTSHGFFWQNLKSCLQPKNFENFIFFLNYMFRDQL